jgi:hypothetical protein
MEIIEQLRLPGSVKSVCLRPGGDEIVVAVDSADQQPHRSAGHASTPTLHGYRFAGGKLRAERKLALRPTLKWPGKSKKVERRFREMRLVFRDARTVLVARLARLSHDKRHGISENLELFAIDWDTGEERAYYVRPRAGCIISGLALAPPDHVLLGAQKTVICLEASCLREVCLARPIDQHGELTEPGVADEDLVPEGIAYDPDRAVLHLLYGRFNEAALVSYRFDALQPAFVPVSRRLVLDGHVPAGLSLNTFGSGLIGSFQIMDELIDLRGNIVPTFDEPTNDRLVQAALDQSRPCELPMPRTANLGRLGLFSEGPDQWIELHSEIERDFTCAPYHGALPRSAQVVHIGYRLSAGVWGAGTYMTKPISRDDRHDVVGTPNGFVQVVDVVRGEATMEHDLKSPINSLVLSPEANVLLAGCEDGTLTIWSAYDQNTPH